MRSLAALVLIATALLSACANMVVVPTDPAQDAPPTAKLSAFTVEPASGYAGDIEPDKANLSASATVKVTRGASLSFIALGVGAGGVQKVTIEARRGRLEMFKAEADQAETSDGKAYDTLTVSSGSPPKGQVLQATISSALTVTVTAQNFHGQTSTIVVDYVPADLSLTFSAAPATIGYKLPGKATLSWTALYGKPPYAISLTPATGVSSISSIGSVDVSPASSTNYTYTVHDQLTTASQSAEVTVIQPPPPPKITQFSASPNNGYNPLGTTDTLAWHVDNCSRPDCNVTLNGKGTGYDSAKATFLANLPPDGALAYTPGDITNFKLSAASSAGSGNTKSVQLSISPSQQPPVATTTYYFTIIDHNPDATAPCSTIAVTAQNEMQAEQVALAQYGSGYSIGRQISESEFNAGQGCN